MISENTEAANNRDLRDTYFQTRLFLPYIISTYIIFLEKRKYYLNFSNIYVLHFLTQHEYVMSYKDFPVECASLNNKQ